MTDETREFLSRQPFKSFFETWQAARDGDDIPFRHKIELRAFATYAENLVIYQRKGRRDLRYRLAGSAVSERTANVGPEVNLFDFFVPDMLEAGEQWWNPLFDTPCGGVSDYSIRYPDGSVKSIVTLLLPIKTERERDMLLSLHQVGPIERVGEPRERFIVGEDHVTGHYFDIGFGLPDSPPAYWPYRPRS